MSSPWSYLDFLDSREQAVFLWVSAVLGFMLLRNGELRRQTIELLRVAFAPKLLLLFGSAALYSASLIILGASLGIWQPSATAGTESGPSGRSASSSPT